MYYRVSLRGMLRLIRVDTLHRVHGHNVGFLAGRLIYSTWYDTDLRRVFKAAKPWENIQISLTQSMLAQSEYIPCRSIDNKREHCEFESWHGQHSFRRLTRVNASSVIHVSTNRLTVYEDK